MSRCTRVVVLVERPLRAIRRGEWTAAARSLRELPDAGMSGDHDHERCPARGGTRGATRREGAPHDRCDRRDRRAATSATSGRRTALGSSLAHGSTPHTASGSSPTAQRRSRSSGYGGFEGDTMVVVENTPDVHNVVVCTLCSCYPWPVLGLPPTWYKSPAYRARVGRRAARACSRVRRRAADDVEIRVWDSTAEVRYLVLPHATGGHGRPRRGRARRARDARQDDRHRARRASRMNGATDPVVADPDAPQHRREQTGSSCSRSRGRAARSASRLRSTTQACSTSRSSARG